MIPLATLNLALGAAKAIFEFLCSEQGQKLVAEGIRNRERLEAWWNKTIADLPAKIAPGNPMIQAIKGLFS